MRAAADRPLKGTRWITSSRVPRASSKPRESIIVSCVNSKEPVNAISAPEAAPGALSPKGGPKAPNGVSSPQSNGNGGPSQLVAPSRPRRLAPREEPEPEPEAVPIEASDALGPSESALLAALSMKDHARAKQPQRPNKPPPPVSTATPPAPATSTQPPAPTPPSTTPIADAPHLIPQLAPAPSNVERRTAQPVTHESISKQMDTVLAETDLSLPTASPEALSASVAPPKAPTRIASKPASSSRFMYPSEPSPSAAPAAPTRPSAPSPPRGRVDGSTRPTASDTVYAPPTPGGDFTPLSSTPKRPSAVAAAAADPLYQPAIPDNTSPSAGSSTPYSEDFSLSGEILLEPQTPDTPAPPPPLPPNESLAARPAAPRSAPSRAGSLPTIPQPQRGPDNSLAPGPYNSERSPSENPKSTTPAPAPLKSPRRPQMKPTSISTAEMPSPWESGRAANTSSTAVSSRDEDDNQLISSQQELAAVQEWAEKSSDDDVDLEHPDEGPSSSPDVTAAMQASIAPPAMLTAPVRAPPPTTPSVPPSTGTQDDGAADRGSGQRRGGGRGNGGGQPRGQAPGRGGRTLVDTQRDNDGDGFRRQGSGRGGAGRGRGRPRGDNAWAGAGGQRGSLTAENRRKARREKKEMLAARREGNQRDREEIFEVPPEGLNVGELADLLAVNAAEVVKALFMKGVMAQVNQQLDLDTVRLAAAAFGADAVEAGAADPLAAGKKDEFMTEDDLEFLVPRPPVVCVMGHVDHGKTSLLDRIREASVAEGEAGGITQAIGAYNVRVAGSGVEEVCFLDTPGHEAFSAMRARGAKVTDIAIIIVAADDGVRPQTLEAIAHARAAEVPMVVAINKIDKPGADVERVQGELAGEADLVPEQWGGTVPFVSISAKKDLGIDELLETVALLAEVEEFQANPERAAEGTVLEAHLNRQVGPVATLLVQAGTLRKGDMVQAGASCGRVRKCSGSMGEDVEEALPSTAVSVIGLDAVPAAGDVFTVFENESDAHNAAEEAKEKERKARIVEMSSGSAVTLSTLATLDDDHEALQRMNIIIKADASGTLEAVKAALQGLPQDSVALRFLLASTGPVQPSDIELARSSSALVIGFNIDVSDDAEARAKSLGVQVKTFDVIYALLDDVRARMEGRLKAVTEKVACGKAEVKATFGKGKTIIGGCMVTEGKMVVNGVVEVRRNRKLVYEGDLTSLRRFKDEVAVVEEGVECGVGCTDFWQWEEGDKIVCFELVQKSLTLEESKADRAVDGDLEEALAAAQAEYAEEEARRQKEKEDAWRAQ